MTTPAPSMPRGTLRSKTRFTLQFWWLPVLFILHHSEPLNPMLLESCLLEDLVHNVLRAAVQSLQKPVETQAYGCYNTEYRVSVNLASNQSVNLVSVNLVSVNLVSVNLVSVNLV
jgi:hypothetical protein